MLYNICFLFSLFIIFSIIGWIVECITCTILEKRFVRDRGFLIGPYCPIYGVGGLCAYLILSKYYYDPITLFVLAAVGASILEYVTSYLMEKMFKARWWDYTDYKFNLEGRICLLNAILFGIMGMVFVYLFNPFITDILRKIPDNILILGSILVMTIFLIDIILTFTIITKLKLKITKIRKDSTADIDKQIKEFLVSYSFFVKRILNAFPGIKFSLPGKIDFRKKIQNILNSIDITNKKKKKNK